MSIPALRDLDNLTLARVTKALAREAVCGDDPRLRNPFTINYILNPDAEIDTTGWATYADAAGSVPVDGTGGSPSVSFTRDTTTPLRGSANFLFSHGSANRQGEGVSYAFTIDVADSGKSLTASFDLKCIDANWIAGDMSVWVFNATTNKLMPISSGNVIQGSGTVAVQFTTEGGYYDYRLCIHCATTGTAPYQVRFDNFYVGPTYLPGMPAMSDWQAYTPTTQGFGTPSAVSAAWRRVGDTCEVQVRLTPGTVAASIAQVGLPDGLTIDTKQGSGVPLLVGILAQDIVVNVSSVIAVSGRTYLTFGLWNTTGRSPLVEANGNVLFASAPISFFARVPITGWSGTTAVQPGSRYLWAQRFAANAVRVTTTPNAPGQYRSRRDTTDVAPTYTPSAANGIRLKSGSGLGANDVSWCDIYVGPGKIVQPVYWPNSARTGLVEASYHVNTTYFGVLHSYDPVTGVASFRVNVANASDNCGVVVDTRAATQDIFCDLLVADDPVPVALAPTVYVEASDSAAQVVTANTTDLQFTTETVDTHGAWSGTIFTAPISGIYDFCGSYYCNGAGSYIVLWYNGNNAEFVGYIRDNATVGLFHGRRKMAAGDTIKFRSSVSATRDNSGTTNWLRITRIGDA